MGEWHVRLAAEAGNLKDRSNVPGRLEASSDVYDAHDVNELQPFSGPHLSIVFPRENRGSHSGDYSSDFRALHDAPTSWLFEVRSDDPSTVAVG